MMSVVAETYVKRIAEDGSTEFRKVQIGGIVMIKGFILESAEPLSEREERIAQHLLVKKWEELHLKTG